MATDGGSKLFIALVKIHDTTPDTQNWNLLEKAIADAGGQGTIMSMVSINGDASQGRKSRVLAFICYSISILPSSALENMNKAMQSNEYCDISCRIYTPIDDFGSPTTWPNSELQKTPILVFVSMTPGTDEKSFNDWYGDEHLPLLRRVPFWLWSYRYRLVTATDGEAAPIYLALHGWESMSAFETKEYEQATHTPWRTKVTEQVVLRERMAFKPLVSSTER